MDRTSIKDWDWWPEAAALGLFPLTWILLWLLHITLTPIFVFAAKGYGIISKDTSRWLVLRAYEMLFTPMGMLWLCLPSVCPSLVLLALLIYVRIKYPYLPKGRP